MPSDLPVRYSLFSRQQQIPMSVFTSVPCIQDRTHGLNSPYLTARTTSFKVKSKTEVIFSFR
uniref:Uncharacterized protein n=1 Tax=Arundo donax TaxID=35708 RepID=A0A0A9CB23_ARUDO